MGWCWGGAGIPLIWGIVNHVWGSLVILLGKIPFVGLFVVIGVVIWLGSSGHRLAWQNRRFDSLAQFRETMAVWNTWGVVLFIINMIALIGVFVFGFSEGLSGSR